MPQRRDGRSAARKQLRDHRRHSIHERVIPSRTQPRCIEWIASSLISDCVSGEPRRRDDTFRWLHKCECINRAAPTHANGRRSVQTQVVRVHAAHRFRERHAHRGQRRNSARSRAFALHDRRRGVGDEADIIHIKRRQRIARGVLDVKAGQVRRGRNTEARERNRNLLPCSSNRRRDGNRRKSPGSFRIDLQGLTARRAAMNPKRDCGKSVRILGGMPKRYRCVAPGGDADGFSAGMNGCGVIKISRGPTPVLPAILQRVGVNLLIGLGWKDEGDSCDDKQTASLFAEACKIIHWRFNR